MKNNITELVLDFRFVEPFLRFLAGGAFGVTDKCKH